MPTRFAAFVLLVLIVLGGLDRIFDWGLFVIAMKNLIAATDWLAIWR